MIRRAGHAVNDRLTPTDAPLGVVARVDFPVSVANVTAWGGRAWLYRRAVAAGLRAAGGAVDRDLALAVGAVAGWRSGVLDLQTDARHRLRVLYDRQQTEVAGATLGLPPGAVRSFLDRQQQTPLAWPLFDRTDAVARIGGFRGLGGPWLAPPREVVRAAGALLVGCADDSWWQLEVDVFGSRLTPVDGPGDDRQFVRAGLAADSYLLTVTAELG